MPIAAKCDGDSTRQGFVNRFDRFLTDSRRVSDLVIGMDAEYAGVMVLLSGLNTSPEKSATFSDDAIAI
jgi:hypothetical protein